MKMDRTLFTALMLAASMDVFSAEKPDANRQVSEALREIGATQYEIDSVSAPVKTLAELKEHLATNPRSPLYRLDPGARRAFLKSMVFTNYGLASYYFSPLQGLSVSDAYAVMSLFGEQRAVGTIPGMRARSSIEESMLFVSRSGRISPLGEDPPPTPTEPLPHQACIVDGSSSPPTHWCEPSPGAMCNSKCR